MAQVNTHIALPEHSTELIVILSILIILALMISGLGIGTARITPKTAIDITVASYSLEGQRISDASSIFMSQQDSMLAGGNDQIPVNQQGLMLAGENSQIPVSQQGLMLASGNNQIPVSQQDSVLTGGNNQIPVSQQDSMLTGGNNQIPVSQQDSMLTGGNNQIPVSQQDSMLTGGNNQIPVSQQDLMLTGGNNQIPVSQQDLILAAGSDQVSVNQDSSTLSVKGNQAAVNTENPISVVEGNQAAMSENNRISTHSSGLTLDIEAIRMAGVTIGNTAGRVTEAIKQAKLAAAKQAELNQALKNISFKSGSSELNQNSYTALKLIASKLKSVPGKKIKVAGYTDNSGSEKKNRELSQKRAESVMMYLISKGVEVNRLTAQGYGSASPVDDNNTAKGREANRRVELRIQ